MRNTTTGAHGTQRRLPHRLVRQLLPVLLSLGAAAALLLVIGIRQLAGALGRFPVAAIPIVALLLLAAYGAQGLRWHHLLRAAGLRLALRDSQLLNLAGQPASALFPIGDLVRAHFASQASQTHFPAAAATVAVQELGFTILMVLVATPGTVAMGAGAGPALVVLAGVAAVIAVLAIDPAFGALDALLGRVPPARRLQQPIRDLQRQAAALLRKRRTLAGVLVDLLRVVFIVTAFWLIAQELEPGRVSWTLAAFVLTFASVGGALSMVPGGVGASEAGMVGLLVWTGMSPGAAAAVAVLQRAFGTGMAMLVGLLAYSAARRRFGLGSLAGRRRATGEARRGPADDARPGGDRPEATAQGGFGRPGGDGHWWWDGEELPR